MNPKEVRSYKVSDMALPILESQTFSFTGSDTVSDQGMNSSVQSLNNWMLSQQQSDLFFQGDETQPILDSTPQHAQQRNDISNQFRDKSMSTKQYLKQRKLDRQQQQQLKQQYIRRSSDLGGPPLLRKSQSSEDLIERINSPHKQSSQKYKPQDYRQRDPNKQQLQSKLYYGNRDSPSKGPVELSSPSYKTETPSRRHRMSMDQTPQNPSQIQMIKQIQRTNPIFSTADQGYNSKNSQRQAGGDQYQMQPTTLLGSGTSKYKSVQQFNLENYEQVVKAMSDIDLQQSKIIQGYIPVNDTLLPFFALAVLILGLVGLCICIV